jgi:hypothetical protein
VRRGRLLAAIAGVLVLAGTAAATEDSVTRYHLVADPGNAGKCKFLDPGLARLHTVTVRQGDVEIISAGGIEGRMREIRPGIYGVVFELSGLRLDVVADLSPAHRMLSVADRELGCRWRAVPE